MTSAGFIWHAIICGEQHFPSSLCLVVKGILSLKIKLIVFVLCYFFQAQHMHDEGSDDDDADGNVNLVQCWLGVAFCCGCLSSGAIVITRSRSCFISKRCLLRIAIFGIGKFY